MDNPVIEEDTQTPPPLEPQTPVQEEETSSMMAVDDPDEPMTVAQDEHQKDEDDTRSAQDDEEEEENEEEEEDSILVEEEEDEDENEKKADDEEEVLKEEATEEAKTPDSILSRTICPVCDEGESEKRALTCVVCQQIYHLTCYQREFPKLNQDTSVSNKEWNCPECQTKKTLAEKMQTPKKRKKRVFKEKTKTKIKVRRGSTSAKSPGSGNVKESAAASDDRFARVVDAALKSGKKFNLIIMEKSEEIIRLAQSLILEAEGFQNQSENRPTNNQNSDATLEQEKEVEDYEEEEDGDVNTKEHPDFHTAAATMMPLSVKKEEAPAVISTAKTDKSQNPPSSRTTEQTNSLLNTLVHGLESIQDSLQQLQFSSVQAEVNLIKDVKLPAMKPQRLVQSKNGKPKESKKKGNTFRLYTPFQQNKLEEWYQLSSRPEAPEIHAMFRVINSDTYAARDIQPDGISAKQIRIWFDNRRAKERLDYMRVKTKDARLTISDPDEIQKLKDTYLLEAKEVLESRVSRLRETTQGSAIIIEEGKGLVGPEHGGSLSKAKPKGTKASPSSSGGPTNASQNHSSSTVRAPSAAPGSSSKKRLRIDYVASVRKAIKDARDSGKTDEEIKDIRNIAIEAARVRLHIPTKSLRNSKVVGEEEVTFVKCKLLSMLESNATAEEVADMIELFMALDIPRHVLISSEFMRSLELASKTYKQTKWLVKEITALQLKFESIIDGPEVVVEAPEKRQRMKFTPMQLKTLEQCFLKKNNPGKKMLLKISSRLNAPELRDGETQRPIEFKQVRCWFYKRRSAKEPPFSLQDNQTTTNNDEGEETSSPHNPPDISSTESEGGDDDGDLDEDLDPDATTLIQSSTSPENNPSKTITPPRKQTSTTTPGKTDKGGRIFSRRQIEFIRREYELDPRPDSKAADTIVEILNTKSYDPGNGVTRRQVMTWFSNRRAKERQDYVKQRIREAKATGIEEADELEKIKEEADTKIKDIIDSRSKPRSDRRGKHKREKAKSSASSSSRPSSALSSATAAEEKDDDQKSFKPVAATENIGDLNDDDLTESDTEENAPKTEQNPGAVSSDSDTGDELESVESNYTQTDDEEEQGRDGQAVVDDEDDDLSDSGDEKAAAVELKKRKLSHVTDLFAASATSAASLTEDETVHKKQRAAE